MARTETVVDDSRGGPGLSRELATFGFYLAVAIVMTWPIAITLGEATGLRGDYFNNLWNFWWVRHSVRELHTPWYTEFLYFPGGLSLQRHTLSPLNAIAGALLSSFLKLHAAFNVLLLLKLALSAWSMQLLARYVTGSRAGAVLAGLVYAFNPFHYFYICQVNVFTLEFVPLALLFFVRTYREGGRRNLALAALWSGAIAATTSYYVVYTFLVVGLLVVGGRLVDPAVPWKRGAARTTVAAVVAVFVVLVVAMPLVIGTFQHGAGDVDNPVFSFQKRRANDLLGYGWIGGPEKATVSWPTMLGYSTILLLLASAKRLWRHRFWLLVGLVFLLLSLGESLFVAGKNTHIPMPYALLAELPVLSMLRKADRSFMMVQFVVALLCAEAWLGLAQRLSSVRARRLIWWGLAALLMTELTAVPFQRFDYDPPPYMEVLAADPDVRSVVELPPMDLDVLNARYSFFQTVHEKRETLGYCTAFAVERRHNQQMQVIVNGYLGWVRQDNRVLPLWLRNNGVDLVIHHKSMTRERPVDERVHRRIVWAPFFFVRRALVNMRQTGQYLDEPLRDRDVDALRSLLTRDFGLKIHEDDDVMVFRVSE